MQVSVIQGFVIETLLWRFFVEIHHFPNRISDLAQI